MSLSEDVLVPNPVCLQVPQYQRNKTPLHPPTQSGKRTKRGFMFSEWGFISEHLAIYRSCVHRYRQRLGFIAS